MGTNLLIVLLIMAGQLMGAPDIEHDSNFDVDFEDEADIDEISEREIEDYNIMYRIPRLALRFNWRCGLGPFWQSTLLEVDEDSERPFGPSNDTRRIHKKRYRFERAATGLGRDDGDDGGGGGGGGGDGGGHSGHRGGGGLTRGWKLRFYNDEWGELPSMNRSSVGELSYAYSSYVNILINEVSIFHWINITFFTCGGVLLSDLIVLTIASCVVNARWLRVQPTLYGHLIKWEGAIGAPVWDVVGVYNSDQRQLLAHYGLAGVYSNDAAIVKLAEPINLVKEKVSTACLPMIEYDLDRGGSPYPIRILSMGSRQPLQSDYISEPCQGEPFQMLHKTITCFRLWDQRGYNGVPCANDWGGPAYTRSPGTHRSTVVALTSAYPADCPKAPWGSYEARKLVAQSVNLFEMVLNGSLEEMLIKAGWVEGSDPTDPYGKKWKRARARRRKRL